MIERNLTARLLEALSDTPVVLLTGARQVGKTTLVEHIVGSTVSKEDRVEYLSLDDPLTLSRAETDPDGLIGSIPGRLIIDEVQRVPDLLRAIKRSVDQDRRAGRFLLTGSANPFFLPKVSDSLAGRMEILTLWPLSHGELIGRKETFIDLLFSDSLPKDVPVDSNEDGLKSAIERGGYPEPGQREVARRREQWFESYVTALTQRDIRDIANIERLSDMPKLFAFCASRTATLVNYAEFTRSTGIPQSTMKRYISLLEATYILRTIPAWATNISKRLVRSPKIHLSDTGLAGALIGFDAGANNPVLRGRMLETYVVMEIEKMRGWSERSCKLFHFRTHAGQEVDIVLEDRSGAVVGIEVKGTQTLQARDFKGLVELQEAADNFHRGVLLYDGDDVITYNERIHAVPIRGLWRW
ncbi:MAG: ATP-binding protein [Ignavibacteriae bacterium]|nr:ATP-binding protein [Ignavibacteriota bacterium]MCB9216812.1 ATP-binding protein [Ignavibacteria bacterium]